MGYHIGNLTDYLFKLVFFAMSKSINYLITVIVFEPGKAGHESEAESIFVLRACSEPNGYASTYGYCHGWPSDDRLAVFDFVATNTELNFRIQPRSGRVNIHLTKVCHLNGSSTSIVYEGVSMIGKQKRFVRAVLEVVGEKFFCYIPPSSEDIRM